MLSHHSHVYSIHLLRHLRQTIGQNIRAHRHKRRMLISQLAREAGVSETLLDHYEMGRYDIRLEELFRIACSLKVQVKELL